jgi:spore coat polysaccharide biosynthesis protein SpsF
LKARFPFDKNGKLMQASRVENQKPIEKTKFTMAFLQARMGSRRLPGKVLMRIQGQTILERAIRRLRASPAVHEIAVLTTILPEDDAIMQEAQRLGVRVHRGSELDVLERFQEASERFHPGIVIRATADNPLIEIGSVQRIVEALQSRDLDWCMENDLPYGAATEALTVETLARVHLYAQEQQHREHVTLYIKEHPEEFHTALLDPPVSLRHPGVRLTVDTLEDFRYVDWLIGEKLENAHPLPLSEYIALALTPHYS